MVVGAPQQERNTGQKKKTIKRFTIALICLINFACGTSKKTTADLTVTKIWSTAPHSAFTSLIRFNNAFYCSFREGSGHMPGTDGKIRVIRSVDGKTWE